MPARVFVDTNIWLYALVQSDDALGDRRHLQATDFLCQFSEDMQHGRQVEGRLTIVNPLQA